MRDPDGHRLELYTCDYQTMDSDHEPLRWSLRVDNLLDEEYFSAGFREPGAVARTGLRWEF